MEKQRKSVHLPPLIRGVFISVDRKGGQRKGPRQKSSKPVKKANFDDFRAGQKRQKSPQKVSKIMLGTFFDDWEKNLQGLKSSAWLPKFFRTFGVLQKLSSTSLHNPKGSAEFWGASESPAPFEDRLLFLRSSLSTKLDRKVIFREVFV